MESQRRGRSMMVIRALVLVLAAGSAAAVATDTMRCGNRLIQEGDHLVKVNEACGEPDYMEERTVWLSGYDPSIALPPDASRDHRRYYSLLFSSGHYLPPNRSVMPVPVEAWVY